MDKKELNTALLKAHEDASNGHNRTKRLAELYFKAYELTTTDDQNAGFFFLSNAYVYALESNHSSLKHIETTLIEAGRL